MLKSGANVILLDEPTNDLDVNTMRALEEARLAEELATRQYTNGLVSIFNLIDSQTRRLTAESNVIAARSARASNRVSFHLALGGGLPVAEPAAPIAASTTSPEEAVLP